MTSTKWKTKDGRELELHEIENDHLLNIMAMLRRHAERLVRINDFEALAWPMLNGEMAQYYMEQEQNAVWDKTWADYVPEIYWDMKHEAQSRGLDV